MAAKRIGSKSEIVLTLFDATGKMIATSGGSDGSREPLLVQTFDAGGRYSIRAGEWVLGASADHYYRLSIGEFPYVTGCYPLSVPSESETEVELLGKNLPAGQRIKVKAGKPGEIALPLDAEKFRSRREFKLLVSEIPESFEREPNDLLPDAMKIILPASIAGRVWNRTTSSPSVSEPGARGLEIPDADLFQFEAKAGQSWIIETAAAQRGTPTDTKVEVLNANGKPIERVLLQAIRNSAITFRGIDSNAADCRVENWEEMDLNQYLYLQGEWCGCFAPRKVPIPGLCSTPLRENAGTTLTRARPRMRMKSPVTSSSPTRRDQGWWPVAFPFSRCFLPTTTMASGGSAPIPGFISPRPRMGAIGFASPMRAVMEEIDSCIGSSCESRSPTSESR